MGGTWVKPPRVGLAPLCSETSRPGCRWCGRGWWCDRVGGDGSGGGGYPPGFVSLLRAQSSPALAMGGGYTIVMPPTCLSTLGCFIEGFRAGQLQNEREKGREIARCFCAAGSALGRGEVGCCALLVFLLGGVGPLALAGGRAGGAGAAARAPHPVPPLKGGQRPVPLRVPYFHSLSVCCNRLGENTHTGSRQHHGNLAQSFPSGFNNKPLCSSLENIFPG